MFDQEPPPDDHPLFALDNVNLTPHSAGHEAWHVLEESLRFRFADREVDAPAGSTVFVPAGTPHTYRVTSEPSRYLIFLTPRLDRLIARLHNLSDPSELRATLAEFDTVLVE